ncbi:MAG: hypothetical protein ABSF83_07320 [Nitrososphaerales archaeon]
MNKRSMYVVTLAVLLLGVVTVTSGVWLSGSFSHGDPSLDQGCYCHNNGIAIYVNGTGDGNGGLFFSSFAPGSSFHLYISTNNVAATGVVPGLQQWFSNQTDNAKFTFSPTSVTDGSAQDRSPTAGNITALYKITVPSTPGMYTLTLYAQGSEMQPILIQVAATSTSTSTTTSSPTTTSSSTHSTTSSTTTSTSTTASSTSSSSHSTTSTTTASSSASTTSSTKTSTTTTTTSTTTTTTSTSGGPLDSLRVATNAQNYSGSATLVITGTLAPVPAAGTAVELQIVNPEYTTVVYNDNVTVAADGTFSYAVNIVANSTNWVSGVYTLTVTAQEPAPMTAVLQFSYSPLTPVVTTTSSTSTTTTGFTTTSLQVVTKTSTATTTVTQASTTLTTTATTTAPPSTVTSTITTTSPVSSVTTTVTAPPSTVTSTAITTETTTAPPSTVTSTATTTAPASTLTSTATQVSTSTVTQTTSGVPDWIYGAMAVLLLAGLAAGYVLKRPPTRQG